MSDKDFLVVISEMLRKQDQQAGKLDQHTEILRETNETLKKFVEVSIEQFQQQHIQFEQQQQFNEQFRLQFEKQNQFNERFFDKLDEISKKP